MGFDRCLVTAEVLRQKGNLQVFAISSLRVLRRMLDSGIKRARNAARSPSTICRSVRYTPHAAHQIVGEVVEGATAARPLGSRVGILWMCGTDGECWFCRHQMENLCDHPTFTGYTVDGGYAEYALVRSTSCFPCRKDSTRYTSHRSCVRVSSAFGACVLPECSRETASAYTVLEVRLRLRSQFSSRGVARFML